MSAIPLSVVLPTFNEAGNILELIARIRKTMGENCEIIVVDDDSPDRTWELVAKVAAGDAQVRLHRRIGRAGLTSAIQEGIDLARGTRIGWMDCDLSMPPEKIPDLVAAVEAGADIAAGSRYVPGGGDERREGFHVVLSRIICTVSRLSLGWSFTDYTSGFIVARREVFERVRLCGDYGEYFMDLIFRARRLGFTTREIPYVLISRVAGESKTATHWTGFFKRGRKYVYTVVRLRLFGSAGAVVPRLSELS